MKKFKNTKSKKEEQDSKNMSALKGFFKSGENYVPHLSRKEKILAGILEETKVKKDSKS